MDRTLKTLMFWFVIIVSAILLWQVAKGGNTAPRVPEISYSEFLSQVEAGNVSKVVIHRDAIDGTYHDNRGFRVMGPVSQEGMLQTLRQKNVEIWFKEAGTQGGWPTWLLNLAPLVLLAALWFFMIRQIQQRRVQT